MRHGPVGSIIAACRRVTAGDGTSERRWRAWRVPPEGPPYLEWEGTDVRNGVSWSATAETPQERIARMLDADLDWTFERWLLDLEASPDVHGAVTVASRRNGVHLWRSAISRDRRCQ